MRNYNEMNDYELMYMVEDSEDIYQLLYDKYQPLLLKMVKKYYYSFRHLGVEYDDLFQEAFLAFDKAIHYYQNESNTLLYTYICISVKSKLQNYIRGFTTQKSLLNLYSLSFQEMVGDNNDTLLIECIADTKALNPVEEFHSKSLLNQLKQFSLSLSVLQGQIFELKVHGFDNHDIAELLELHVKDVSNHIYRIRKRLKLYLEY